MNDHDPMALLRQWQDEALRSGVTAPDEVVLSTVSADGDPSARMVSAKSITSAGIVFGTRLGTRKVADLAANARCTFTFWWPSLDRSVRVACVASPLDQPTVAQLFAARPRAHQIQTVVSPQGSEIVDLADIRKFASELDQRGSDIECPAEFGAYLAVAHTVEFWQQGASRLHDRIEYRFRDNAWTRRRLAP